VAAAKSAVLKSKLSNTRILLQAVVAGVFISLGAALFLQVGGACPTMQANDPGLHAYFRGLIGLPFGLTLTVFTGKQVLSGLWLGWC
jgi:formate/nitrite transporter FocA (FNT family)